MDRLKNKNIKDFSQIQNCITRNPLLSLGAYRLYSVIMSYDFIGKGAFPSQARLAEEMGISERWVRNALCELMGWGLITKEVRGRGKTNIYHIEVIPAWWKDWYFEFETKLTYTMRQVKADRRIPDSEKQKETKKAVRKMRMDLIKNAKLNYKKR